MIFRTGSAGRTPSVPISELTVPAIVHTALVTAAFFFMATAIPSASISAGKLIRMTFEVEPGQEIKSAVEMENTAVPPGSEVIWSPTDDPAIGVPSGPVGNPSPGGGVYPFPDKASFKGDPVFDSQAEERVQPASGTDKRVTVSSIMSSIMGGMTADYGLTADLDPLGPRATGVGPPGLTGGASQAEMDLMRSVAAQVKDENPDLFVNCSNADGYSVMTKVLNILRSQGLDARRLIRNSGATGPDRWSSDKIAVRGKMYDLYYAWGDATKVAPSCMDVGDIKP